MNGTYLLIGKDSFLKREFIRDLRKYPFDFQEFNSKDHSLAAVTDFLRSPSFLSDKRLAVLWDIDALSGEEKEILLRLAQKPSPTGVLVLVSEEGSAAKDRFLKELSQQAKLVACHPPFEKDLPGWVRSRAKTLSKEMPGDAALLLIEKAGRELSLLHSAIEVLALYVDPRTSISLKDVEALLGRSAQADVFRFAEALLEKNAEAALEMAATLLREGSKAYEIVGILAGQLDRLRKITVLLERGIPSREIGAQLKIHPFFLEKTLRQAKTVSTKRLRTMFERLSVCDESIKTSSLNDRLALERLVLELCLERRT